MERTCFLLLFVLTPAVLAGAWKSSIDERQEVREMRRGPGIHYHSKRHMLPNDSEVKRRVTTLKSRLSRKKPTGHLTPLREDDMDNDEVVSVAIGPPPMRPKYEKVNWKHLPKNHAPVVNTTNGNCTQGATNMVKDVLTQLGREFMTHQVSEDFVFGQYVGNAMANLTSELKLKMQHEILELVIRYQMLNRGETPTTAKPDERTMPPIAKETNLKKYSANDTDEGWPDFSNLAKIVG